MPYICHSPLQYQRQGRTTLITSIPKKTDCDIYFIVMLIKFCYRRYADHLSLEVTEDGEFYLRVSNIHKIPPQVLYNIAIASRTPVEHGHYFFRAWAQLAKAGVNPMLAFILSTHNLTTTKRDPLKWTFDSCEGEDWHFFLDPTNNWKQVIEGAVEPTSTKYCIPCNTIWGVSDYSFFESVEGKTVQEICDILGYPVVPDPSFPQYEGKTYARKD